MKPISVSIAFLVCQLANAQTWNEVIKAVADDRADLDAFGTSVAISGDYAIVGAVFEDEDAFGGNTANEAGSAYIFTRIDGTWTQQQKIVADDRAADDRFGWSVAISGDYAIIGALNDDEDALGVNTINGAGSAYIFARSGSTWNQQEKIVASDRATADSFGYRVAISGDYAIVGTPYEDHDASGGNFASWAGSAYIFSRNGNTWMQQQKIVANDRASGDQFGWSLAISGDYAIVGAVSEDEDAAGANTILKAGSAYVFTRTGNSWNQQQKLVASDRANSDDFGNSVAISGEYAIVGAVSEDEDEFGMNTASAAGSAYIFERIGDLWTERQKIVAGDRAANDTFGNSVAISGDHAIVGARGEDEDALGGNTADAAGSAYIFTRNGSNWTQEQKIVASDRAIFDTFGSSVATSGDYAIVGVPSEDEDDTGGNTADQAGAVYFFTGAATYTLQISTQPENGSLPVQSLSALPLKICADGSKATIVSLQVGGGALDMTAIRFRLAEGTGAVGYSGSFDNVYDTTSTTASTRLTHPAYLPTGLVPFRNDTLEAYDINNPESPLASVPVQIYRAPVFFLHGFYGDESTFEQLFDELIAEGLYPSEPGNPARSPLVLRPSYRSVSLARLSSNKRLTPAGIDYLLEQAIAADFSCGKVTVVAHSMGGLLARLYLQSTWTGAEYRHDLDKLITLNTPHYGTQFANYGLEEVGLLSEWLDDLSLDHIDYGAIRDFKVDSWVIREGINIPQVDQERVPSATLSSDEVGDAWPVFAIVTRVLFHYALYTQDIYDGEVDDLIVPLSSQEAGIATELAVTEQWHIGSAANDAMIVRVKNLLSDDPAGATFAHDGFPPATLTYSIVGSESDVNGQGSRTVTDSIAIAAPIQGASFAPNDLVNVSIDYTGNISHMALIVSGNSIDPIVIDTTNVGLLQFQVPSTAVGTLELFLLGGDSVDWTATDESFITIASTLLPDSITCVPAEVTLPLGLVQTVQVNGFFGTSEPVALNGAPSLAVSHDDVYLLSLGEDVFQAIAIGTTSVTCEYMGLVDTMVVHIVDDPGVLAASFDYSDEVICAGSTVAFANESQGLVTQLQWSFPGGSPANSSSENPVVVYPASGVYSVSLITTFVNGIDTLIIDSLIQVQPLPTAVVNVVACNTYTSPSGSQTWSQSGQYTDTIQVEGSCDSLLTINLTIEPTPNAGMDGGLLACNDGPPYPLFNALSGSPDGGGEWMLNGALVDGLFTPNEDSPGLYGYIVMGQGICANDTAWIDVSIVALTIGPVSGPDEIPTNSTVTFEVTSIAGASGYDWSFSVPPPLLDWSALDLDTTDAVAILETGGTPISAEICVQAVFEPCPPGNLQCYPISTGIATVFTSTIGQVAVVPNPSSGEVLIVPPVGLKGPLQLEVFNGLGQSAHAVVRLPEAKPVLLDMRSHAEGVYILRYTIGSFQGSTVLIIQREE